MHVKCLEQNLVLSQHQNNGNITITTTVIITTTTIITVFGGSIVSGKGNRHWNETFVDLDIVQR